MKILQINRKLYMSGGSERVMFEDARFLKKNGHTIHHFSMKNSLNFPSDDSRYFVSNIEYYKVDILYKLLNFPKIIGKNIYSFESKKKLRALLNVRTIDLAHLHLLGNHISPSILPLLRKYNIPVVQTVHTYRLICPNSILYISHKNQTCERCLGGDYFNVIKYRCEMNSLAASSLAYVSQCIHKFFQIYERHIDLFIAPSRFMLNKLVEGGVLKKKIRYLPNTLDLSGYAPNYEVGDYLVFLGRLVPEKGIKTLIRAMAKLPEVPLLIVGEGEQRQELERNVNEKNLTNVTFTDYKKGKELQDLLREAAFLIIPSEWYENCPMVILEAHALGKPVIGANIGGIPEGIDENENGLLFEPGNVEQLAEKIRYLYERKDLCEQMGRDGRAKVEMNRRDHYERLIEIYDEAKNLH